MARPTKNSDDRQEVTLFREMLFLPLRLTVPDDKERLAGCIDSLTGHWVKPADNLAFQQPSRIWPPRPQDKPENPDDRLRHAYGEAAYFHPYVQRFLYGFGSKPDREPVRTLIRTGIEAMRVRLSYGSDPCMVEAFPSAESFEIDLTVDRIELNHVREPGLVIFVIELAADGTAPLRRFDGNGKEINGRHHLSMAEVLAIKDGLRRLFPPFFFNLSQAPSNDGAMADKHFALDTALFPASVEFVGPDAPPASATLFTGETAFAMAQGLARNGSLPAAPWWHSLLQPLIGAPGSGGQLLEQVVDERMPSLSFVAVPDLASVTHADQIRLCFADHPGKGLPYAPDFLADFVPKHCYDRFLQLGTRYMFSSYSLVALCQTGVSRARPYAGFDFPLDVIQEHMRRHYLRMFMLAHIQRASLLAFSNWISRAMQESETLRDARYRSRIDDLRRGFVEFTQISWFSNLSNQEQARDMFALTQEHMGTAALQAEVLSELDGARAVLTEIDEERQAESAMAFNVFAGIATLVGLPLAVVSAMKDIKAEWKPEAATFLSLGGAWCLILAIGLVAVARRQNLGRDWASLQPGRGLGLFTAYGAAAMLAAAGLFALF
jgi:hypothetical protein